MSKSNDTAASKMHTPESKMTGDQAHAHSYPGRKTPKAEKVMDASHDQAAHDAGRKNSMGVSANGSHKGLPASYEYVGHKSGTADKDAPMGAAPMTAHSPKHDGAELAAGRKNSMGTSADGSHKGMPTSEEKVGQV